jgi:hypothetical protein
MWLQSGCELRLLERLKAREMTLHVEPMTALCDEVVPTVVGTPGREEGFIRQSAKEKTKWSCQAAWPRSWASR